jgi:Tfp pilus assembly protein PilN
VKARINFSPKPFRTRGPLILLLWAVNLALLVVLGFSLWHWNQLRGENRSAHDQLDTLEQRQREIAASHRDLAELLEKADMKGYRLEVRQFHEIQVAFNTHWGRLLDDLGDILPEDVRITRLEPSYSAGRQRENSLKLAGEARNKEAQLSFVKALQQQPAFTDLRFESEDYDRSGVALAFEISFVYRPGS